MSEEIKSQANLEGPPLAPEHLRQIHFDAVRRRILSCKVSPVYSETANEEMGAFLERRLDSQRIKLYQETIAFLIDSPQVEEAYTQAVNREETYLFKEEKKDQAKEVKPCPKFTYNQVLSQAEDLWVKRDNMYRKYLYDDCGGLSFEQAENWADFLSPQLQELPPLKQSLSALASQLEETQLPLLKKFANSLNSALLAETEEGQKTAGYSTILELEYLLCSAKFWRRWKNEGAPFSFPEIGVDKNAIRVKNGIPLFLLGEKSLEEIVPHNLTLKAGQPVVLVGNNRVGKSTLIRNIYLLDQLANTGQPVPADLFVAPLLKFSTISTAGPVPDKDSFKDEAAAITKGLSSVDLSPSLVCFDDLWATIDTQNSTVLELSLLKLLAQKKAFALISTHNLSAWKAAKRLSIPASYMVMERKTRQLSPVSQEKAASSAIAQLQEEKEFPWLSKLAPDLILLAGLISQQNSPTNPKISWCTPEYLGQERRIWGKIESRGTRTRRFWHRISPREIGWEKWKYEGTVGFLDACKLRIKESFHPLTHILHNGCEGVGDLLRRTTDFATREKRRQTLLNLDRVGKLDPLVKQIIETARSVGRIYPDKLKDFRQKNRWLLAPLRKEIEARGKDFPIFPSIAESLRFPRLARVKSRVRLEDKIRDIEFALEELVSYIALSELYRALPFLETLKSRSSNDPFVKEAINPGLFFDLAMSQSRNPYNLPPKLLVIDLVGRFLPQLGFLTKTDKKLEVLCQKIGSVCPEAPKLVDIPLFESGKVHIIVGPNRSGKTELLKLITLNTLLSKNWGFVLGTSGQNPEWEFLLPKINRPYDVVGESSFEVEMEHRIQNIFSGIRQDPKWFQKRELEPRPGGVILVDDPVARTTDKKSAAEIIAALGIISIRLGNTLIITTHAAQELEDIFSRLEPPIPYQFWHTQLPRFAEKPYQVYPGKGEGSQTLEIADHHGLLPRELIETAWKIRDQLKTKQNY